MEDFIAALREVETNGSILAMAPNASETQEKFEVPEHEKEADYMRYLYNEGEFVDDLTGRDLSKELVIKARMLELKFFRDLEVYNKVPRRPGVKTITTK